MMFETYLNLGIDHILDWNGRDHILFIVVMICIYRARDWRQILYIVTSFTLAHTISLALSVFGIFSFKSALVELLIACTILFTAVENVFLHKLHKHRVFLSGFFGLIHGLGFSNYLKSLLSKNDSILLPLFSFNLGVEVGQLIIVLLLVFFLIVLDKLTGLNRKIMIQILSILIAIQAFFWILDRI